MIRGLYKDVDPDTGEERVFMDAGGIETFYPFMERGHYEASDHQPPFDELPSYEQYLQEKRSRGL